MLRPVLMLLFLAALPDLARATEQARRQAADLCQQPPLTEAELDRLRRGPGYVALIEGLAMQCPDVAMLFSTFVVGELDAPPNLPNRRHPPDFLHHVALELKTGSVATIPEE